MSSIKQPDVTLMYADCVLFLNVGNRHEVIDGGELQRVTLPTVSVPSQAVW